MNKIIHEVKTSFGTIPMVIDNDYQTFKEFYDKEKHNIYTKIVEIFEEILKENIEDQKLLIVARIDGVIFNTGFKISKSNKKLFTQIIIPYFESIEEYEVCKKVKELLSQGL